MKILLFSSLILLLSLLLLPGPLPPCMDVFLLVNVKARVWQWVSSSNAFHLLFKAGSLTKPRTPRFGYIVQSVNSKELTVFVL